MEQFSQLFKYLNIIYGRRYLFLTVSLLSMSILIGASYRIPKQYETQSTVFIEKNVISRLVSNFAVTPDMQDRINVLRYAMLSRGLIERALNKVASFDMPDSDAGMNSIIQSIINRTDIQVNKNDLFIVSFTDNNPVFAQEYVNSLVKLYVEENLGGKRDETYGANRFLDEQLVHFKEKLDETENAIIEFRKKQGVFAGSDDSAILTDIRTYQREIENIELTIETQKARKKQSLLQLKNIPMSVAVFNEQAQVDSVDFLETRLRQLLSTYNENYPEIIRLKAELESLKQASGAEDTKPESPSGTSMPNPVYQEVQQNIFDLESEISSLQGRKRHLEKIMLQKEMDLKETPENKKMLDVLVQERDSSRRIYEQLLMSAGQSEVSKQMELGDKATTFRIVDMAILPLVPVSPNMVTMILMSIAGGFLLGGGLVLGIEILKGTIISAEDVKALGCVFLAAIPTIVEPEIVVKRQRRDKVVYCASFAYFALVVGVLVKEVFNLFM